MNSSGRRERHVQEEADAQVGPELAQQRRDQLQVVVLHPHHRAGLGDLGRRLGEPPVDARYVSHQPRWKTGGSTASWYSGQSVELAKPS